MTIIVDSREPKEIKNKLDCDVQQLEVGDYIIGNLLIERKAPNDFVASIISKRLWNQAAELKEIKSQNYQPMVAIVGDVWRGLADRRIRNGSSMIFGAYKSLIMSYHIPIITFGDVYDFIDFIKCCDKIKVQSKGPLTLPVRKGRSIKMLRLDSLSCIPGLSGSKAKLLLDNFKTIRVIANANFEELVAVKGVGEKNANSIVDFFKG